MLAAFSAGSQRVARVVQQLFSDLYAGVIGYSTNCR